MALGYFCVYLFLFYLIEWRELFMKLFEVRNGYYGEGAVRCFVIAETEDVALKMASESFREESNVGFGDYVYDGEKHLYPRNYWEDLRVRCVVEDTSVEWRSKVNDY